MGRAPTNTKQKLLETATDLVWRESYNAVSVDEICKKAGVKKGSFYHYFPSKAHLALEAMDVSMQEMKVYYDDIFSPTREPVESFKLMVRHVIDKQKEIEKELGHVCGCPFATLGSELAAQDEEIGHKIAEICAKKTRYYESGLRALISKGLIGDNINVETKAKEIFSFVVGQLLMARIHNDLDFIENNLESAVFNLIGVKEY